MLSEIFFAALDTPPTEDSYLTAIKYVSVLDILLVISGLVASFWLPRRKPQQAVVGEAMRPLEVDPATD